MRPVAANHDIYQMLKHGVRVSYRDEYGGEVEDVAQVPRLEDYPDDQLWAVVYQRMAWPQRERLRELVARGKQGDLTSAEQAELEAETLSCNSK
ncbi:MAG: hypothetical protein GYB66_06070 [Chloroflexi bacterium]|nr:hypothetical protein [Chloroflexota bacterium]